MKVLLLEPDEYYHRQFIEHLGGQFEIFPARDAAAAERMIQTFRPEIVVSELLLDEDASFYFLENLRRKRETARLPVVIYSCISTLPDVEYTLSLGVSGYFIKGTDSINDVKKLLLNFAAT